jgi:hypothetical protein
MVYMPWHFDWVDMGKRRLGSELQGIICFDDGIETVELVRYGGRKDSMARIVVDWVR